MQLRFVYEQKQLRPVIAPRVRSTLTYRTINGHENARVRFPVDDGIRQIQHRSKQYRDIGPFRAVQRLITFFTRPRLPARRTMTQPSREKYAHGLASAADGEKDGVGYFCNFRALFIQISFSTGTPCKRTARGPYHVCLYS